MESRKLNIWGKSSIETTILSTPGKFVDNTNFQIAQSMAFELGQTFSEKYYNYPVFGISACQIAKTEQEVLQLFFLHENGKKIIFANPKIVESSDIKIVTRMYCCSTNGGKRVLISAPVYIILEFLNIYSGKIVQRVFGHPSTASIIHELSHLAGKKIEVDMIKGTKVCKGNMLENLNEEEKTRFLLGKHFLAEHYLEGDIFVKTYKGIDTFLLRDGREYQQNNRK